MTQQALDELMRRVLLDALRADWDEQLPALPALTPSKGYLRQIGAMLADPLAWRRKKTRPVWKKVLRTAAMVAVTISVTFAALMAASPTVRAAVAQWVREIYQTHIVYRYSGQPSQTAMPQYGLTDLPQGYVEVERIFLPGYVNVIYQNEAGMVLYLDYSYMQQGSVAGFLTQDMEVSDITVNGCPGQFFFSLVPEQSNMLTWVDETQNIQFTVNGFLDKSGLLHISDGMSLVESTK